MIFGEHSLACLGNGSKTQTRRIIKPQPLGTHATAIGEAKHKWAFNGITAVPQKVKSRYMVGDVLYVKEALVEVMCPWIGHYLYPAAKDTYGLSIDATVGKVHGPMFMKERHARYHIKIVDIQAEKLHKISKLSVVSEGYRNRKEFFEAWVEINHEINLDRWVFVYTFEDISDRFPKPDMVIGTYEKVRP